MLFVKKYRSNNIFHNLDTIQYSIEIGVNFKPLFLEKDLKTYSFGAP